MNICAHFKQHRQSQHGRPQPNTRRRERSNFQTYVTMVSGLLISYDDKMHKIDHKRVEFVQNCVFWVVTPCGSCKNRRFGGTWRLLHQGDKNR
jgi:hypothetical protein